MRSRAFTILGIVLFLLALGPRWMPAIGINPQAAVNGAFLVAFTIAMAMSLANRLKF